jgi:hypothetical protein
VCPVQQLNAVVRLGHDHGIWRTSAS